MSAGVNAGNWPGLEGEGTEANPYQISSAADFLILADNISPDNNGLGEFFEMTADIDFGGDESKEVQFPSIGKLAITNITNVAWGFEGVFDGNNHTVSGIYHTENTNNIDGQFNALFSSIGQAGVVKNLNFGEDNYVSSYNYVGSIASVNKGKILNCVNEANIEAANAFAAGICGYLVSGTGEIENCINRGNVSAMTYATGIVAGSQSGPAIGTSTDDYRNYIVSRCDNYGTLSTSNGVGSAGVAGTYSGVITSCNNYGTVDDTAKTTGQYTAGIVASAIYLAELSACVNNGEIRGTKNIGGICGIIMKGDDSELIITDCENNGEVTATGANVAGILANTQRSDNRVMISDCINNGKITTTDEETDLIGNLRGTWAIALGENNEIAEGLTRYQLDPQTSDDNNDPGSSVVTVIERNSILRDGKYIINNSLVIVKNGVTYNIHGQRISIE